jgi:hypothetical protein
MEWGTAAVRTREGEGSFYGLGMAEGRRSDEVNAGGSGGVLMDLQTSVLGWERRGRHLLLEEKWRSHRGVSVPMCRGWPEGGRQGGVKPVGGGGYCWLKEEDARLGRCWATRPGGSSSLLGWHGKERRERWVGCIMDWAQS